MNREFRTLHSLMQPNSFKFKIVGSDFQFASYLVFDKTRFKMSMQHGIDN